MIKRIIIILLIIALLLLLHAPITGFTTEFKAEILSVIPVAREEVRVSFALPADETAVLIVASFDDDLRLTMVSHENITIQTEVNMTVSPNFYMAKAMLWDGFNKMRPISNVYNLLASQICSDIRAISLVCVERTMDSIRYLTVDIGSRVAGTENEERSIDWLISEFEKIGLETEKHEFYISAAGHPQMTIIGNITIHDAERFHGIGAFTVSDNFGIRHGGPFMEFHGDVWETGAAGRGSITGSDFYVTGDVLYFELPELAPIFTWAERVKEALENTYLNGKTLLMREINFFLFGMCPIATIANIAADEGAVAVMIYSGVGWLGSFGQAFNPNMTAQATIPVLGLAFCHGEWLKAMVREDTVTVDIQTAIHDTTRSWNAIGVKPAENNPDYAPILMVIGHIDSVVGTPGANDNASGTAVVLESARALMFLDTSDVELRFIGFGAEEVGLVGAIRYVARMSSEERARVRGVFNLDLIGSADEIQTLLAIATVNGMPNLISEAAIATANRLGYGEYVELVQFSSSDHVPFHNAGMPAIMGSWMGRARAGMITPSNFTMERYIHTPQDTIEENICKDRLRIGLEIATATIYYMALNYRNLTATPVNAYIIASEYPDINEINGSWRELQRGTNF
ncbi:MAG: M28 family peptidase [Oscillospiraceae bacterium]|nr:M28 family peptidase [Oscillospiraceae bacterium]